MELNIISLGHSALLFDTGKYKILIDPFINENPKSTIKPDVLNPDYIVITHGHGDHIGDTIEIAKRSGAKVVANFEISNWLNGNGVSNTHPMNIGGSFEFPFGKLKQTIAHHSSILPDGSYGGNPSGLIFYFENFKVYFAGDTGLFLDMKLIGEEELDLAILPIGDNFTMGPSDALKAVGFLNPKKIIPVHYGTFDAIGQDPEKFKDMVGAKYPDVETVVLRAGAKYCS
ncbi:MAG: metal-dependent hydrolase [Desulfobacterales bacterium]|nr:metal-dependent hydrolase [Desulfobacterales bacterium]MCP4160036.1 metal-dependent hydrolase [Deltaproteobacteria bacterium]